MIDYPNELVDSLKGGVASSFSKFANQQHAEMEQFADTQYEAAEDFRYQQKAKARMNTLRKMKDHLESSGQFEAAAEEARLEGYRNLNKYLEELDEYRMFVMELESAMPDEDYYGE